MLFCSIYYSSDVNEPESRERIFAEIWEQAPLHFSPHGSQNLTSPTFIGSLDDPKTILGCSQRKNVAPKVKTPFFWGKSPFRRVFSQKEGVLTFGATFFHWEHPEIVLGLSKDPKNVGEVKFWVGGEYDGVLAPRFQRKCVLQFRAHLRQNCNI